MIANIKNQKLNRANVHFVDKVYLIFVFILFMCLAVLPAASFVGFDSYEERGFGKVLLIFEVGLLPYFLRNLNFLRIAPSFTRTVIFWIPWVFLTCFNLLLEDTSLSVIMFIMTILTTWYWCFTFLYFYILLNKYPQLLHLSALYFFVITIVASFMFYKTYLIQNVFLVNSMASINGVYFVLLTLPWVLLLKKSVLRYIGCGIIAIVVFLSMKRTALIVFSVSVMGYFFIDNFYIQTKSFLKVLVSSILLSLVFTSFVYINNYAGGYFLTRLSSSIEDQGSGRVGIYKEVLDIQYNSTFFNWIFGHGYNTVTENISTHFSAHNDWQEVLFDFGIIGLILYILLHVFLIKKCFKLIHAKHYCAAPFFVSYVIFFFMSLWSNLIIYPTYFIYLVAFLGAVFGATENERQTNF